MLADCDSRKAFLSELSVGARAIGRWVMDNGLLVRAHLK